jgi:hypothetical protein
MTIHFSLSLSEVSYKFLSFFLLKSLFFLLQLLYSSLVCEISLIDTFQHWLLYNKLSSNNNINNYHHVSVIQICVLKLTTCRVFCLVQHLCCHSHLCEHQCQFCSQDWSTAACFVCNIDVLIVILNNENNDDVNEDEHIARSRQIASILLSMRTVIIDLDL